MRRKIWIRALAVSLILMSVPAAMASGDGLFGILSRAEDADERLALVEEAAVPVSVSRSADQFSVEVSQAYFEGNRVFVSYRVTGGPAPIQDGLDLEDGAYADIIAGDEVEQEDGSVIGWKECVVPEEETADTLTFSLVFGRDDDSRISFTLTRSAYDVYLRGTSGADTCRAMADLAVGKIDIKGTVLLTSPEQAASWIAWQEGEEETGTDVIACWNLYQNGELVSVDLCGASRVNDSGNILFEMMFPRVEDFSGLSLVPEYSEAGENPDEAIPIGLVTRDQ